MADVFAALADERISVEFDHAREDARRRAGAFAIAALFYLALAAALWLERSRVEVRRARNSRRGGDRSASAAPAAASRAGAAKAAGDEEDLSVAPAYDAPKAGAADKESRDKTDEAKAAPAPEAPDRTAERAAGAEASAESPKPEAIVTPEPQSSAPPVPLLPQADEGDVPLSRPQGEAIAPAAPAKPRPAAGRAKFAVFASLPNVAFAAPAEKAPVAGGEGPAGYLNVVVGMIRAHLRRPPADRQTEGRGYGVIVFRLDSQGHLMDVLRTEGSGSAELDKAEMTALQAAAPFPPPPYLDNAIEYRYEAD